MSNIIPISENQAIQPHKTVQKTTDICFKDSLNKALGEKATTETYPAARALGEIQAASFLSIESPIEKVVTQTNQLLDLLRDYADDLNNQSKSLKDIAPLLNTIHNNANNLLKEAENMAVPNEALQRIASEVALTARLESIKFHRGDYI
ncbi:MAG: hypothetical protein RBT11_07395 [Desulfobacterales bacterium]|jgi:hypothetical protein|nr:hypothetical protein [Desulfobacterales bacterium]